MEEAIEAEHEVRVTISNFRRDNPKAIRKVFQAPVGLQLHHDQENHKTSLGRCRVYLHILQFTQVFEYRSIYQRYLLI